MVALCMLQILLKIARVHALRLPVQIMVVGKRRYCGSRNFIFLGSSMVIGIRFRCLPTLLLIVCTRAVALGQVLVQVRFSWSISKHFSDDKSFSPLFDCFHIRLEHSAQLLKMRENFLPLHNVYLCRYLQRDLYPHCDCYQQVTETSTPGRRDRLMM
ncbi:hypothetical protein H5410_029431 [Solanum commersonii]|uniref:Secreted protein n=1 Tax=Solanum commersonii TaxID=4109 RepID=A0A9J5Z4M3_SOLCO|nr:hypothetical protein H5410_029431 [Solanum commersonii]